MTDNEIKKALECCKKAKTRADCEDLGCPACVKEGCVYYIRTDEEYEGVIFAEIAKDLVDLINRLEEENANYSRNNRSLTEAVTEMQTALKKQSAEIERLQKENNQFADIGKMYSEIKAEAIKEFTSIIESNDYTGGGVHLEVSRDFWDKTKKEMVGDAE